MKHESVLLDECIENLRIKPEGIYVDGTLGGGGHSLKIAEALNENGRLIAIDQDPYGIKRGKERLKGFSQVTFVQDNFSNLENILDDLGIDYIDGILLDLGISSFQVDDGTRGFSFHEDAILDMRMSPENPLTAEEVVNTYTQESLASIFKRYAEEPFAWPIAKAIVRNRNVKPIKSTFELVEIIKSVLPEKEKKKKGHPGRRVFQSLRIEVNQELRALEVVLDAGEKRLARGGRFVIITFHSLEDRIVKHFFNEKEHPCTCPKDFPICVCQKKPTLKHLTRKVILPKEEEIDNNHRARSAKLRVAQKL